MTSFDALAMERDAPRDFSVRWSRPIGFEAHLEFFDADGDQRISARETQQGLERIGLGYCVSVPATVIIHLGVAGLGIARGNFQNPLHLALPRVSVLRHPDTALIDAQQRLDLVEFETVFERYGRRYAGTALTLSEIAMMASARLLRTPKRLSELLLLPGGAAATFIEWSALLWLAGESHAGVQILTKEAAKRFYLDPDFFSDVATRLERLRERRRDSVGGRVRNVLQTWFL